MREVKNLTNIKLTESDADGIWLHFESNGLKAEVDVSMLQYGDITSKTIQRWARDQLDRQIEEDKQEIPESLPPAPSNEFLKEGSAVRTDVSKTRPSLLVEGGY